MRPVTIAPEGGLPHVRSPHRVAIVGGGLAGVAAAVGASVKGVKEGDRVTFDSTVSCGACFFCRRGEINLCDNRQVLGVSCGDYRR